MPLINALTKTDIEEIARKMFERFQADSPEQKTNQELISVLDAFSARTRCAIVAEFFWQLGENDIRTKQVSTFVNTLIAYQHYSGE